MEGIPPLSIFREVKPWNSKEEIIKLISKLILSITFAKVGFSIVMDMFIMFIT